MATAKQMQKITLKGSAEIVAEFFCEYCVLFLCEFKLMCFYHDMSQCLLSGVQRSGDAWGDCLIGCPQPNSSIQQWCMVVIVTRYTMFVMSSYDVILTFANQRFGEVC